jgi:hypothetical protein
MQQNWQNLLIVKLTVYIIEEDIKLHSAGEKGHSDHTFIAFNQMFLSLLWVANLSQFPTARVASLMA